MLRVGRSSSVVLLALVACGSDDPAISKPFLWRIDAAAQPSYLLGTIHVGVAAAELPSAVWEALDSARTFAAESDITQVPSAEELAEVIQLPPEVTLDRLLTAEAWELLQRALPDVPTDQLRKTHPWVVQTVLQQSLLPEHTSMDETLMRRARNDGKSLEFFETLGDFGQTLESISPQLGAVELEIILRDSDGFLLALDQLVQLYREGDVGTMRLALYGDTDPQSSPESRPLLADRNDAWFPALERIVRQGGAFVAVGLAHLIGPDNLLDLLAAKGFESERVGIAATDYHFLSGNFANVAYAR